MKPGRMEFGAKIASLTQACVLISLFICLVTCDEPRNLQNHRNGILNLKEVADHWIGFPKSPYTTSFTVTSRPFPSSTTPPTSAPLSTNKYTKQKKTKSKYSPSKRRDEDYDPPSYNDKYQDYADDNFDYDYNFSPVARNPYRPSYVVQTAATTPNTVFANPAISSSSQTLKTIYAGIPKVATYVVPNTKKYVVQRVKSEAVYVPPTSSTSDLYAAASNRGMRRVDPMDYDDTGGGGNNFLNLGPQEGFPPRPVMNKISQPGQRQPCHGPDCHQHHKGLVRFYWRRVVYPPNERGRGRGRGRFRRPGRGRRRRLRGSARAPSDQRDVYYTEEDNDEPEEEEENNPQENVSVNNEDVEEDEEEEDNQEEDTKRRNVWQPERGYGHDLSEGSNYDERDMKTYRDKRFAYRRKMRRRYPRPVNAHASA